MYESLKVWLERRKLKLNEKKTRILDFRKESFEFLGFRLSSRRTRNKRTYVHIEPSPKKLNEVRQAVREETTCSTLWKEPKVVFARVNQRVRGWSEYFHYGSSTKAFGDIQGYVQNRMRRWLWRKHNRTRGHYTKSYDNDVLHEHYGLLKLPLYASWKHS